MILSAEYLNINKVLLKNLSLVITLKNLCALNLDFTYMKRYPVKKRSRVD